MSSLPFCRHKQVMLEAYDRQCDEASRIFAEYHKRLCYYINQARDAQKSGVDSSVEMINSFSAKNEKESVYSTVKSSKSADDVIAEAAKLGFDFDGQIPDEVRTVIVNCLKSPPLLLQAITAYTSHLKSLISREIEKIDVRADAEILRLNLL
ncbi:putative IMP dehydrogenase/GMP reductase [Trifolium medium]|uniref:Putative IMP dehydrogenase/GMP reductase n=1 Tax=Trifolium medium TaxID=97028 RepID=A0A392MNK1_9FABA|nr:putative IMP dehydrogenase/GMP reductase [Trifolium medium]